MSRYHLLHYVLVAAAASLTACEPYDHHDAPAVAGYVTNGATQRPVAGAIVTMTAEHRSEETYTDEDGHFALPRLHHWGTFPFADGYLPGNGVLRIDAPGYRLYTEANIGRLIFLPSDGRTYGSGDYAHKSPDWKDLTIVLTPGSDRIRPSVAAAAMEVGPLPPR